jgi:4'-phosphopantetheinyl transferase
MHINDEPAIDIWYANISTHLKIVSDLETVLSEYEINRADRFRFERHRIQFVVARATLRHILSSYLSVPPKRVEFQYAHLGKPLLDPKHKSTLKFNISHTNELVAIAISLGRDVGIDIESLDHLCDYDGIATQCFTKQESEILQSVPKNIRNLAFFNAWTRKEAFLKACGLGLSRSMDTVPVTLLPGAPACLLGDDHERWSICELSPPLEHVGALVVAGSMPHVKVFHW